MHTYPVISLKPSYNSVVRGCPGIPETLPRVECQLQIRSNNGLPFTIDKIELMLLTVETLHHNSHLNPTNLVSIRNGNSGIPSPTVSIDSTSISLPNNSIKRRKDKLDSISVHYKKTLTFKRDKKIIGSDIPLTIALPDDIKETNFNNKFGNCYTLFDCKVYYNGKHSKDFKYLINIERYSYLPSKTLFPPVERTAYSLDERFKVSYKIENPCLSNDDLLRLTITFKPNFKYITEQSQRKSLLFNKKIKLKHITFQLKELLEINESLHNKSLSPTALFNGLDRTEDVLQTFTKEINQVISMNEINIKYDMRIFTKNKLFQNFESAFEEPDLLFKLPKQINRTSANYNNNATLTHTENSDIKTEYVQNKNNNIPFQYHTSITTLGNFFNITHRLNMKFKISGGKGFEVNQSLILTPWPRPQLKYIQQLIQQEKETAYHAKKFYGNFGGIIKKKTDNNDIILEYPNLPPVVYNYDTQTLSKFNIQYDKNCKPPQRIPLIQ
ncbi:RHO1 GEF localizing protein 1 [Monosporozyma servazzii]